MKIRNILTKISFLPLFLLSSCIVGPSPSSEGTSEQPPDPSQYEKNTETYSSEQENNPRYLSRISSMVNTSINLEGIDANKRDIVSYDETTLLGSAKHPLLNQTNSDYFEIIAIEQPKQYGDAFLIVCGDAQIVIDCGNNTSYDFDDGDNYGDYLTSLYTQYIPDKKLELFVASHPHSDHIGGYSALTNYVSKIEMFVDYGYTSNTTFESLRTSSKVNEYRNVYNMIHSSIEDYSRTYITQELFIDWIDTGLYSQSGISSNSLFYNGERIEDLNVTSVVGILSYRYFSYFFQGDLQNKTSYGSIDGEDVLLKTSAANRRFHTVTMAKAGHHGSNTANYNPLLNRLAPKAVVISAGRVDQDNRYPTSGQNYKTGACSGHPHNGSLERILASGRRVNSLGYLNASTGTLHFVTNGISSLYVMGEPLKSNLIGSVVENNQIYKTINISYGSTANISKDLLHSDFYNLCHV